jgi:hypothetical protein
MGSATISISPLLDSRSSPGAASVSPEVVLVYSSSPYAMVVRAHARSIVRRPKHALAFFLYVGFAFATGRIISGSTAVGCLGAVGIAAFVLVCPQLVFEEIAQRLVLRPDGMTASLGKRQRFYPWTDIAGIDRDRHSVTIYLANLKAFVVPASAFGDPSGIDATVAALNAWREAAVKR